MVCFKPQGSMKISNGNEEQFGRIFLDLVA